MSREHHAKLRSLFDRAIELEGDALAVGPLDELGAAERGQIEAGADYIADFNRVLSRWYEQEKESCD